MDISAREKDFVTFLPGHTKAAIKHVSHQSFFVPYKISKKNYASSHLKSSYNFIKNSTQWAIFQVQGQKKRRAERRPAQK